ncbi:MAG TPA: hypothetical protein VGI55_01465 [Solirubrobacteraceae bacterium]
MSLQLGPRRVVAPDGVEWRVRRRWLTSSPRLPRPRRGEIAAESLNQLGTSMPDFGNGDLAQGLLVAALVVACLVILIPVLFFGIELIILGVLLATGVIARTVLRQPWLVEADSVDSLSSGRHLEWHVRGWQKSSRLIAQVASDLSAGREPG